ncbi:unnamed protein product [Macrosiphum euphorbiae]|uniref:DUF4806 domain-containing protein n=1 Tax=Macrosiphum euphorbiae TaxID=13131 RepID=A0AAV0XUV2_9HEMI|nr:unnamed protein product [Macrosiphum euphorbiae]
MSPKITLSQKYGVSPIKKTPTKISFNDYSPNLFMSSQKHYSPKNSKYNLSNMPGNFVKKQLFKPKESSSTHSTSNDQFKDMVSHNLITMKHSIRNLNENFDLMIERSSKLSQSSNQIHEDDVADNYTNLNCIFPINDVNTLNDIEEQLAADKTYHKLMTNKLVGLGGKTIQIYVKRVMHLLFTDELLKYY